MQRRSRSAGPPDGDRPAAGARCGPAARGRTDPAGVRIPSAADARLDDRSTGFEDQPVADYLDTQQRAPDPFAWKAPGGESYRELVARVHGFLAEVCTLDEAAVLVVTHHQVMQAAAGYFRELTPADMWRVWVDNGATLEFDTADAC